MEDVIAGEDLEVSNEGSSQDVEYIRRVCASFGNVAECFAKLEATAAVSNSADACIYIRRTKQIMFKSLSTRIKRRQSKLDEYQ